MAIAIRHAETVWEGPLATGSGVVDGRSGALAQLRVTWAARTERPDGTTNPEELRGPDESRGDRR